MVGKHTHVLIIKNQATQLSLKSMVCRQQALNLSFSYRMLWRPNHRQMCPAVASEGREEKRSYLQTWDLSFLSIESLWGEKRGTDSVSLTKSQFRDLFTG